MKLKTCIRLVSVFALIALVLNLASCYYTKYRFIHDKSEITSIEIVENRYSVDDNVYKDYQNVLVSIDNVEEFLIEFESVPYKMPFYNGLVTSFGNSEVGIKFIFKNGDYEILSSGIYSLEYRKDSGYDHAVSGIIGFFDDEKYEALVGKYLSKSESPKFYFMNDTGDISTIEIVDAYMSESEDGKLDFTYEKIVTIEDTESFLNELNSLEYRYSLHKRRNGYVLSASEHKKAIKITYNNGDYEIFSDDWRDIYVCSMDKYINDAYIGNYEKAAFDEFLNQRC